jgi:SHAQKYF class myb-like DNA-binding protein
MLGSCPHYLGLKLYGKNWRKIEELVVTRNGSQIRSHAQKYFMKMTPKGN